MTTTTKTIKPNSTLTAKSICDSDCIFSIKVIKRTAKMATIIHQGNEMRVKIKLDSEGNEFLKPDNYSMAPVFRAI